MGWKYKDTLIDRSLPQLINTRAPSKTAVEMLLTCTLGMSVGVDGRCGE
jgi:hypothetical protein